MKIQLRLRSGVFLLSLLILLVGCASAPAPFGSVAGTSGDVPEFAVYYIDVGQADSALVVSGGETMLIDGGNTADSDLIYAFLKSHEITRLDFIVATHVHEDHVGGLAGALNYAGVGVAFCPVSEYDSGAFENFDAYLEKQNVAITVPNPGDTFTLGDAAVEILAPVREYDEPNDTSIVLKIVFGDTGFLFTGDAERPAEQDILEKDYDLSATVLKVGHHGSDTATTYPFLREIMPQYAIISCGSENSYGHPHKDLLSRLRDAGAAVYRTDLQGTITCVSDGRTVSISTEKNANVPANQTVPAGAETATAGTETPADTVTVQPSVSEYIGNINSRVFHIPSCPNLPAVKNRVMFFSREEAVGEGYSPCGNCEP